MMKQFLLLFAVFILPYSSFSQKTVELRNLWAQPQVHVLFEGYTISFTIRDIDRALVLLSERGINTYGNTSGLDTTRQHHIELYPGFRQQYRNNLQPMVQNGVGVFLLSKGRAVVRNPKRKKLKSVIMDVSPFTEGVRSTEVKFYDPKNDQLLFTGRLAESMRNADLGIDHW
jgi:hypothetical protein